MPTNIRKKLRRRYDDPPLPRGVRWDLTDTREIPVRRKGTFYLKCAAHCLQTKECLTEYLETKNFYHDHPRRLQKKECLTEYSETINFYRNRP